MIDRLLPELLPLAGCPQDPEWHPEGDVWTHTLMVVDQARSRIGALERGPAAAVMLGGMLVAIAGVAISGPVEFVPIDALRRQLEVNLVGQVAVTQAFLPALRQGSFAVIAVVAPAALVAAWMFRERAKPEALPDAPVTVDA